MALEGLKPPPSGGDTAGTPGCAGRRCRETEVVDAPESALPDPW